MNRRKFLTGLAGVAVGAALAEELSTRSIFLPPRGGWFGTDFNKYLTSNTAWFLKTEHRDGLALYSRAHPGSPEDYVVTSEEIATDELGRPDVLFDGRLMSRAIDDELYKSYATPVDLTEKSLGRVLIEVSDNLALQARPYGLLKALRRGR